jgi:hypothetical protein
MISDVPFMRRKNPDSTHDSICMTCFLTVAHGANEADLIDGEQKHDCERAIQEEWLREGLERAS